MCSRSLPRTIVLTMMLGVLVVALVRAPAAKAADFYIMVSPDRGPVGTSVVITGYNDPGLGIGQGRTVVWRCDLFGADDRVIAQNVQPNANGWWSVDATVPDNCVTQPNARGESEVWVTAYGNAPVGIFTIGEACPPVLFLGAHGVNEGAEGGAPDEAHWGATVQSVWQLFEQQVPQAWPAAADYPRYDLPLPDPQNPPTIPAFAQAVWNADTATDFYAAGIVGRVVDQWHRCGTKTKVVLVGFSQGAWAVDKALRVMRDGTGPNRDAIGVVAGVGLLGDPAFPPHFCTGSTCRQGIATWGDTVIPDAGMGYHSDADYINNGVDVSHFASLCLSYSDQLRDPVCGVINPLTDFTAANIAVHTDDYAPSGGTERIAKFLAGLVG